MGPKLDWSDEEILQYALGELDIPEYEIDGMKSFLENDKTAKQKYENYLKIINMHETFQPSEKEYKEYKERMIQIIREKKE